MTALAILHHVKFFANTIYVGLQVFMGQPSTKIESLENLAHEIINFSHKHFRIYGMY